jgi:hypothetical protein
VFVGGKTFAVVVVVEAAVVAASLPDADATAIEAAAPPATTSVSASVFRVRMSRVSPTACRPSAS